MKQAPQYKRILLKASGEALMGEKKFGIDPLVVERVANDIAMAHAKGVQIGVVVGGGNIFRGVSSSSLGADRVTGDHMGMLATVINSLALRTALEKKKVPVVVLSAISMPQISESFSQGKALSYFNKGRVVLFAAGTGNPFFTTDTAAVLRAVEIGADVLLKATQVDGIYTADPNSSLEAEFFEKITYDEVLEKKLRIMDMAAIALARENQLPIIVYSIKKPNGLADVLDCKVRFSTVVEKYQQ